MSHTLFSDKLHPKNGYIWTRSVKYGAKIDIQVFIFAFCIKNNLSKIVLLLLFI